MDSELLFKVALGNIPNVGSKNSKTLIAYCGSAQSIFKTTKGKLLKIPGVGEKIADAILTKDTLLFAENEIERATKENVELLFFTDANYPLRLKQINDAPPLLYYKGNTDLNQAKILSIVGTRNITSYGKRICERILEDLKDQNILIVSGLAYGVDIFAHKAALKNNLPTLGIMANGLDKIYPAQHVNTTKEMLQNGGLMTEEPYGTIASAQRFPARNRIVAGIADGVLVIESADKGGSLITANIGFSYDKEIMAVPGEIDAKYSKGCNDLIKDNKAHLISSANDILKIMNWDLDANVHSIKNKVLTIDFDEHEARIVNLLQQEQEQTIDEIAWKLQLSPNALASTLLNLEFGGVLAVLPGKKFRLK